MVLSCFVICKWAGVYASHRQALANDCQGAKEKSFSLVGKAYNLAIMVTMTVCFSLCRSLSSFATQLLFWLFCFELFTLRWLFVLRIMNNASSVLQWCKSEWTLRAFTMTSQSVLWAWITVGQFFLLQTNEIKYKTHRKHRSNVKADHERKAYVCMTS